LHNYAWDAIIDTVKRTTLVLDDDMRKRLRLLAAQRGVSMSALIRQAIEQILQTKRPKPSILAAGDSGRSDIGGRAGDFDYEPPSWR
jgi:plasmid stability protein